MVPAWQAPHRFSRIDTARSGNVSAASAEIAIQNAETSNFIRVDAEQYYQLLDYTNVIGIPPNHVPPGLHDVKPGKCATAARWLV